MSELTPYHSVVVDEIGKFFEEGCRWPTFAELDRVLYRDHDLQGELVLGLPADMVHIVPAPEDGLVAAGAEVALTAVGLHASGRGRRVLGTFLMVVRQAADLEHAWEPPPGRPNDRPVLAAAEVARFNQVGESGRDDLFAKVGAILCVESWGGRPLTASAGADWSFEIGRQVRRFRAVPDIDTYLKLRLATTPDEPTATTLTPLPWWVVLPAVCALITIFVTAYSIWGFLRAFSLVVLVPAAVQVWRWRWLRRHWRDRQVCLYFLLAMLSAACFLVAFLPGIR